MPANGPLFQKKLIAYGSCTLAHMKNGSLFRIDKKDIPNIQECMSYFNKLCSPFGYYISILDETDTSLLVYIYNAQKIKYILSEPSIQTFLSDYGYDIFQIDHALNHLRTRLSASDEFPHEIGIFLGYPLQDIKEFIAPQKECLLIGYWKVYGNARKFRKEFHRFDCCRKAFEAKMSKGESLVTILKKLN